LNEKGIEPCRFLFPEKKRKKSASRLSPEEGREKKGRRVGEEKRGGRLNRRVQRVSARKKREDRGCFASFRRQVGKKRKQGEGGGEPGKHYRNPTPTSSRPSSTRPPKEKRKEKKKKKKKKKKRKKKTRAAPPLPVGRRSAPVSCAEKRGREEGQVVVKGKGSLNA